MKEKDCESCIGDSYFRWKQKETCGSISTQIAAMIFVWINLLLIATFKVLLFDYKNKTIEK